MEQWINKSKWIEYGMIVLGAFLIAASVNLVYEPVGMVTGGVSGIAIVLKYVTKQWISGGIPIWFTNVIVNIPIFIVAVVVLGKKYVGKTLFATVVFSIALYMIPSTTIQYHDLLLPAVFGGVIGGIGLGLVFATSASTGGTDLLGAIIQHYMKHYSVAQVLLIIDALIVLSGVFVFGLNNALYAVISVYILTKSMDTVLEGFKFAKLAYIISDHYKEIAEEILNGLDRGVTGLPATGMYLQQERKMLFCVVSKKEIVKMIEIVSQKDPKAFVIVSDVREVMGEGFVQYGQ